MEDAKVFSSDITRDYKSLTNDLYDLLKVVPVKQLVLEDDKPDGLCDFKPNCEKHYIPKKRSGLKVRTVSNIREIIEKDTFTYLNSDLEKIQTALLKKIQDGELQSEKTKKLCFQIVSSEHPINRFTWRMLMNVNPQGFAYPCQYMSWEGKPIQISGSKGGNQKFIYNFDLGKKQMRNKQKLSVIRPYRRKKLLTSSLDLSLRPGPLCFKKNLDVSHQKFYVGNVNVKKLPKAGLNIYPTYGIVLHPTISIFLNNLRDVNGTISKKWAELAVSALGSINDNKATQSSKESITFDLSYRAEQKQILMRLDHNSDTPRSHEELLNYSTESEHKINTDNILRDVNTVVNNILDYVEISLLDPAVYTHNHEPMEETVAQNSEDFTNVRKASNKGCRKKFKELKMLDVTVIRLPEMANTKTNGNCGKPHCSMGCVCSSLEGQYLLKEHCGRNQCMLECKCEFSQFKAKDTFEKSCSDFVTSYIDSEINIRLAKEEQKFHQTVLVTDENSIVLKSQRRHLKQTKKYIDCNADISEDRNNKLQATVSIPVLKFGYLNVEPWCMVHNLYKCFCKGRIVNTTTSVDREQLGETTSDIPKFPNSHTENDSKSSVKSRPVREKSKKISLSSDESDLNNLEYNLGCTNVCRRTEPYTKRKHDIKFYKHTHRKIYNLELNDKSLQIKLKNRSFQDCKKVNTNEIHNDYIDVSNLDENGTMDIETRSKLSTISQSNNIEIRDRNIHSKNKETNSLTQKSAIEVRSPSPFINEADGQKLQTSNKLTAWIVYNYKKYKEREALGLQITLDPPKKGKLTLFSGEYILKRYQEHKNLVLVSKVKPYKLYLSINDTHPFFKNCINIDEIRFADLHIYPSTVKSLLTNSSDLKYTFYILSGLDVTWELIGTVTKIDDTQIMHNSNLEIIENNLKVQQIDEPSLLFDSDSSNSGFSVSMSLKRKSESDSSDSEKPGNKRTRSNASMKTSEKITKDIFKWFAMTIENDFTEIQFYKRGFFVKYESIMRAIQVARLSGKTVRLSPAKCIDGSSEKFGVYAIPKQNENCVFVGPYEKDDKLDIETVRAIADFRRQKRTRGLWFTEKKENTAEVIEHSMKFLPPCYLERKDLLLLEKDTSKSSDCNLDVTSIWNDNADNEANNIAKDVRVTSYTEKKTVKPIQIKKSNTFYQCAPGRLSKSLINSTAFVICPKETQVSNASAFPVQSETSYKPWSFPPGISQPFETVGTEHSIIFKKTESAPLRKPIAEVAPQIKSVFSLATDCNGTSNSKHTKIQNMMILKPEEINKRVMQQSVTISVDSDEEMEPQDQENEMDVENFLAMSVVRTAPEIYLVSDSEEEDKQVWIHCTNIPNIGYIKGKRNSQNLLSFEFPGFKFTDFYQDHEAFAKINQVLSRKVYVPKTINLEWEAADSIHNLKNRNILAIESLNSGYIMTRRGLLPIKTYLNDQDKGKIKADTSSHLSEDVSDDPISEGEQLMKKLVSKRSQMMKTLGNALTAELNITGQNNLDEGLDSEANIECN